MAKKKTNSWQEIEGSDKPVPSWLSATIAGHNRIWGRTIINYPLQYMRASYESGNNPRLDPNVGYELIAKKIKLYGFIGSVPVVPIYRDSKNDMIIYEVISGDRRFLALRSLGYTAVNIEIYEGSEKEIAPLRMALNMESEVPPADQALYIYNILIRRYNYTHEQIAEICSQSSQNVGRTWVTLMASIGQNCTKQVIDAWRTRKIKKAHVMLIAKYFTRHDVHKQKRLLKFIIESHIKASHLKKNLANAIQNDKNEINIHDVKKGYTGKKTVLPAVEEDTTETVESDGLNLAALIKKPKRIKQKKRARRNARTTFELIMRYEKLKAATYDDSNREQLRQCLLEECKWMLQMTDGKHRCLLI